MKISEIRADEVLKALLENKIKANKSMLKVYGQNEMPNKGLADDFIRILYNGTITSQTEPIGLFRGNLALIINCKMNSDGTAKKNRIKLLLAQVETLVDGVSSDGYYFKLSSTPITPVTTENDSGYCYTTLNIQWHTTSFH